MSVLRYATTVGAALVLSTSAAAGQQSALGPKDGAGLPATELDRVKVGSVAPDFSLESLAGDTITLSSFRNKKAVLLVFYRGHW